MKSGKKPNIWKHLFQIFCKPMQHSIICMFIMAICPWKTFVSPLITRLSLWIFGISMSLLRKDLKKIMKLLRILCVKSWRDYQFFRQNFNLLIKRKETGSNFFQLGMLSLLINFSTSGRRNPIRIWSYSSTRLRGPCSTVSLHADKPFKTF